MKFKLLSVVMLFCLASATLSAQDYNTAIGGKLGYGLIASYKKFFTESSAVDIFGGIRWGGVAAGAYYEKHTPIESIDRLQWYWGAGGSFTTWDYGIPGFNSYFEVGVSGVIGLDYSITDIPLNFSVDWAPTIVVLDSYDYLGQSLNRFRSGYGALSVRYILK